MTPNLLLNVRIQILCVIPVPIVRWVLVGIAFGLSGYFLTVNIYPILASVSPHSFLILCLVCMN